MAGEWLVWDLVGYVGYVVVSGTVRMWLPWPMRRACWWWEGKGVKSGWWDRSGGVWETVSGRFSPLFGLLVVWSHRVLVAVVIYCM